MRIEIDIGRHVNVDCTQIAACDLYQGVFNSLDPRGCDLSFENIILKCILRFIVREFIAVFLQGILSVKSWHCTFVPEPMLTKIIYS